jgi:hypothetical protein
VHGTWRVDGGRPKSALVACHRAARAATGVPALPRRRRHAMLQGPPAPGAPRLPTEAP